MRATASLPLAAAWIGLSLAPMAAAQTYPDLPLGAPAPLPTSREAEEAILAGDRAWAQALGAPEGDRAGLRRVAFDAWMGALELDEVGAAVRIVLPGAEGAPFVIPGAWDSSRAAEGVQDGVLRRLSVATPELASGWIERFSPVADAALAAALGSSPDRAMGRLAAVERRFPLTRASVAAALGCADLAFEAGQLEVAGSWLTKGGRQLGLLESWGTRSSADLAWLPPLRAAHRSRRRALADGLASSRRGADHTSPTVSGPFPGAPSGAETSPWALLETHRIAGIGRSASDPFGRGLGSGFAGLADGTVLIQAAPGLIMLEPRNDAGGTKISRALTGEALGIGRVFPRAAASAGGWASLPATDGTHVALVAGRAERPRPFLDLEIPPTGNALGVVRRGGAERPIQPLWVMRDGRVLFDPAPSTGRVSADQLAPLGDSVDVSGWDLGLGWEWQPGPVIAGGVIYALARALGGGGEDGAGNAGEVRLFAIDLESAGVLWSREVTRQRGRSEDRARGDAGALAVTTMPLGIHRPTGSLFVGTNSGLVCAFGAAEGRLLWAVRTQRGGSTRKGWPGSQSPLVSLAQDRKSVPARVWMAPLGSDHAYAFVAGPWPLGARSPFAEPPRPRQGAMAIAAAHPPARPGEGSTLALLAREGRYDAVVLDTPGKSRTPSTYLAPSERFGGFAAQTQGGLVVAGTDELVTLSRSGGYGIESAAVIPSRGAGRGGDVHAWRGRVYIVGRDTIWVFRGAR